MCNSNGQWGNVDYSSCTMRLEAVPLIMVEVKDIGSSTNAISAINQVSNYTSHSLVATRYTYIFTVNVLYSGKFSKGLIFENFESIQVFSSNYFFEIAS